MGATVVLHKSQMGTVPFAGLPAKADCPLLQEEPVTKNRAGKRGASPLASPQWPSEPAARRISGAATCDSSLR